MTKLEELKQEADSLREQHNKFMIDHSRPMTDEEKLAYIKEPDPFCYKELHGRMIVMTIQQFREVKMLERYAAIAYGKYFKAQDEAE